MESEMNFYKIDSQDFVFSVKVGSSGAIRYYRLKIADEGLVLSRIKNAFAFLSQRALPKVAEFSPDYAKIVTSLINYCETETPDVHVSSAHKKAYDYKQIKHFIEYADDNQSKVKKGVIVGAELVTSSRPSKTKVLVAEAEQYYALDDSDKRFIAVGITNNNISHPFRVK